jgi:hypothetical protein
MNWWQLNIDDVLSKVGSSVEGLTEESAEAKRKSEGPN